MGRSFPSRLAVAVPYVLEFSGGGALQVSHRTFPSLWRWISERRGVDVTASTRDSRLLSAAIVSSSVSALGVRIDASQALRAVRVRARDVAVADECPSLEGTPVRSSMDASERTLYAHASAAAAVPLTHDWPVWRPLTQSPLGGHVSRVVQLLDSLTCSDASWLTPAILYADAPVLHVVLRRLLGSVLNAVASHAELGAALTDDVSLFDPSLDSVWAYPAACAHLCRSRYTTRPSLMHLREVARRVRFLRSSVVAPHYIPLWSSVALHARLARRDLCSLSDGAHPSWSPASHDLDAMVSHLLTFRPSLGADHSASARVRSGWVLPLGAAKPAVDVRAIHAHHIRWHGCSGVACPVATLLTTCFGACTLWWKAGPPTLPSDAPVHVTRQYQIPAADEPVIDSMLAAALAEGVVESAPGDGADPRGFVRFCCPVHVAYKYVATAALTELYAGVADTDGMRAVAQAIAAEVRARLTASSGLHDAVIASGIYAAVKPRMVYDARSINELCDVPSMTMRGAADAVSEAWPHCYVLTADVASGFHHVTLDVDSASMYLGIRWRGRYYRWRRLPFGLSAAPYVFCLLSAFLTALMLERGLHVAVTYVDDFVVYAASEADGQEAISIIAAVGDSIGVLFAPAKFTAPTQRAQFLGVCIDTVEGSMSLPRDKLIRMYTDVAILRLCVHDHVPVPLHWFESLLGRLNWACSVAPVLRLCMSGLWVAKHHACRGSLVHVHSITAAVDALDTLWLTAAFHGSRLSNGHVPRPLQLAYHLARTDASGEVAFGGVVNDTAVWGLWSRSFVQSRPSSGFAEAYSAMCVLLHAVHVMELHTCQLVLHTDSMALHLALLKGGSTPVSVAGVEGDGSPGPSPPTRSRTHACMRSVVNALLWFCHSRHIFIASAAVPREANTLADAITNAYTFEQACSVAPHLTMYHAPRQQRLSHLLHVVHICSRDSACSSCLAPDAHPHPSWLISHHRPAAPQPTSERT